jgi:hypothetical protein
MELGRIEKNMKGPSRRAKSASGRLDGQNFQTRNDVTNI